MLSMMNMMGYVGRHGDKGMSGSFLGLHLVLGVTTWILVVAMLAAATRYLWKKGGEKK